MTREIHSSNNKAGIKKDKTDTVDNLIYSQTEHFVHDTLSKKLNIIYNIKNLSYILRIKHSMVILSKNSTLCTFCYRSFEFSSVY